MNISDYHIAIGNATDLGKLREQNEDYMAHFETPVGYCIVVCDGMGGHAAGAVASQNAIVSIQQYLQDSQNENSSIPLVLKNAIEFTNYQLREMGNQNPALKGMGTTCVLALIQNGHLYTAHAGDSRIYIVRKGGIKQITKDHSSVQKLIDMGTLTEEEAELSDKKHQISKAIGIFDKVEATITQTPLALQKNDKILLCSDGLTGHVNKEKIVEIIQSNVDIQNAALKLINLANDGGGSDNITVQLIHYTGKSVHSKRKLSIKKMVAAFTLLAAVILFSAWIYKKIYLDTKSIKTPEKKETGLKKNGTDSIPKQISKNSAKTSSLKK